MEFRKFKNLGLDVSAISFGASSLGSVFRETRDEESIKATHLALDMGINYIDVSPYYGYTKAETVLGKALKGIPRDTYILSTKTGKYRDDDYDYSAKRVEQALDESLMRLGVDYVDIMYCHDIEYVDLVQIVEETLPALHNLKKTGKVKHVGISGLPIKALQLVIDQVPIGMVEIILSYCHSELNDTSLLDYIDYFDEKKVDVVSASPTGMGLLTERGCPDWHPAGTDIVEACRRAMEYCKENNSDIGKLAIQYAISLKEIPTTLFSSASPDRVKSNIEWLSEPMNTELLEGVLEILKPIHNKTWSSGLPHNN
jgi:L-galactose dehydrogenase